jgi:hypothetical protein
MFFPSTSSTWRVQVEEVRVPLLHLVVPARANLRRPCVPDAAEADERVMVPGGVADVV